MSNRGVVGRNILANALGGSWVVVMSLAAIPFQIRILGAEAFGLLGFMASLQIFLTVLDFGLATTVNREIASDVSPDRGFSRDLVSTAGAVYWLIAALTGIGLASSAGWLAGRWLVLEEMTVIDAAAAIRLMALWVAFTWPTPLYASVLTGLQRLDVVNGLRVATSTLTQGGGIVLLLVTRDFHTLLWWMVGTALLSLALHVMICKRVCPWLPLGLRPSGDVVRQVWRFSLDMNLISILTILYTQLDRLLIGRFLPLRMLGYYTTAYSLARGIAIVQGFISSAMMPALASDHGQGNLDRLRERYSKYSQALVFGITLPAVVLFFYGYDALRVWATPEVADRAQDAMRLLAIGFLLNGVVSPPTVLSVAVGQTHIPLKVNAVGMLIYVPLLVGLITRLGIKGAALAWVILNLYYLVTLLPLIQRKILNAKTLPWLADNLLPFALVGTGVFLLGSWVLAAADVRDTLLVWIACTISAAGYLLVGYRLLRPGLRSDVRMLSARAFGFLRFGRRAIAGADKG